MGIWSLYFLVKFALLARHAILWHAWANLALAAALSWPLERPLWRRLRLVWAIPAAVALLCWDAQLPALPVLAAKLQAVRGFSAAYLWELTQRAVPLKAILWGVALFAGYSIAAVRIRFTSVVFAGMGIIALLPAGAALPPQPPSEFLARAGEPSAEAAPVIDIPASGAVAPALLNAALADGVDAERGKVVSFDRAGIAQFDLIILSVCSLSNDDLYQAGPSFPAWLGQFDLVFRHFNSAASYSGPAVLRLLRATCGQVHQAELYRKPYIEQCHLFENLQSAGFRPSLLLNHDGQFDNFLEQMQSLGGVGDRVLDNHGAQPIMTAFDDSPVRSDGTLLTQWWRSIRSDDGFHALVYNTISLHDGNHVPGLGNRSPVTYAPRLRQLTRDFDALFAQIEASGRPTVVVLMPEHGAALRATDLQMSGLREIPTPSITEVPAAVRFFGFPAWRSTAKPVHIDAVSSYLDMMLVLGEALREGPSHFAPESLATLAPSLPSPPWVAENEDTIVYRAGSRSFERNATGAWTELSARDALAQALLP